MRRALDDSPLPTWILNAVTPTLLILSFSIPAVVGAKRGATAPALAIGWAVFVAAFAFQDLAAPLLARHFYGRDRIDPIAADQPGTCAAVAAGWVPALIGFWGGRLDRRMRQ